MNRTDRGTLALLAGYLVTFAITYALDSMVLWLVWATLMVVLVGSVMVWYNR
ncbi:hypothetical protein G6M89_10105 [Natronolimnobius sp. AArcel1]|uniref:hypothetical protein n=1 Tax=Natronolimnobius sp. AArcel1 TaxID=1679093 RepID=UPI0013EDEB5B|nr:hypothetical protein [Natronolimnobius sp. AArcel1]NGM69355.1 hypothetical protein [Natronolimnobius sp. AArcel1]